jgi:2-enoate reductase|nr:FAD-dependent oxidoreductase [uncultured Schaedlerella sp.]
MSLLKQEGTIGKLKLKNRLIMAPMGIHNGDYTQDTVEFYKARIEGGASMIMCNTMVTGAFEDTSASMLLTTENIDAFHEICEIAHANNCKVCPQLMPGCGRVGGPAPQYGVPVSASACDWMHAPGVPCHELTLEEIRLLLDEFRRTVKLAVGAGADAAEIHAYGGYLTDQFLTACWNTRTDAYGGSLEGRMKFLLEMVQIAKEEGGDDFPVIVKYSASHDLPVEYGFRGIEEGIEIGRRLEAAGVDALHVDAGCYEKWHYAMPPIYFQEMTPQIGIARAVREAVSIPVVTHGRLGDVEKAEAALRQGCCDFVAVARGILADPELPNKVMRGNTEDIRPCISCNDGCIGQVFAGQPAGCAVNPICGYERTRRIPQAQEKKKVLVVGAGPGGCAAALMADKAGHTVELWEKTSRIGGKAHAAAKPYMKEDMLALSHYYQVQLAKSGVKVRCMQEAGPENVREYAPDVLIWAAGGKTLMPGSIQGLGRPIVYAAEEALEKQIAAGETIVVAGGGLVGTETAVHFDRMGRKVVLIEMAEKLLPNPPFAMNEMQLRGLVEQSGIEVHTNTKLVSVGKNSVTVEGPDGMDEIVCDTVLMALGYTATAQEAGQYEEICQVISIGDSNQARNILSAVSEAYEAVVRIS